MRSAENMADMFGIFDLLSSTEKEKIYGIQKILNDFLTTYQSVIEESPNQHYKIFYDNEKELVLLLSPYLKEEDAGWLIREIGLNCYTFYNDWNQVFGILTHGFEVYEVKFVD